jgi:hypothetical protein
MSSGTQTKKKYTTLATKKDKRNPSNDRTKKKRKFNEILKKDIKIEDIIIVTDEDTEDQDIVEKPKVKNSRRKRLRRIIEDEDPLEDAQMDEKSRESLSVTVEQPCIVESKRQVDTRPPEPTPAVTNERYSPSGSSAIPTITRRRTSSPPVTQEIRADLEQMEPQYYNAPHLVEPTFEQMMHVLVRSNPQPVYQPISHQIPYQHIPQQPIAQPVPTYVVSSPPPPSSSQSDKTIVTYMVIGLLCMIVVILAYSVVTASFGAPIRVAPQVKKISSGRAYESVDYEDEQFEEETFTDTTNMKAIDFKKNTEVAAAKFLNIIFGLNSIKEYMHLQRLMNEALVRKTEEEKAKRKPTQNELPEQVE